MYIRINREYDLIFTGYFYSLSPEADKNPWLQQSLTAAKKKKCSEFYCTKTADTKDEDGAEIDDDTTATDDTTVSHNPEAEGPSPAA